jgi:hypothetical protein
MYINLSKKAKVLYISITYRHYTEGIYMKNDVRQGSMFVCENGVFKVQCPLKHTSVKAKITGFLAEVEVEQEFSNPSKSKIEAVCKRSCF